jgi:hypothetical protein
MDTEKIIKKHYTNIVMNKPDYIEVKNTYERYCVYEALQQYASNWQSIWFNKSYKKENRYAKKDTCKYCFRKKQNYENIIEWQEGDDYYGDETYHNKCNTCGDMYASIWSKGDVMFVEKIPYKINIFYSPKKKMRCFVH